MRSVAIVVGTRPEAIKLAPVIRALAREEGVRPRVIATGQHREMLDLAFAETGIEPDILLDLMRLGESLPSFTGRCVCALGRILAEERPAYVIVQGDTTSALAGALAAYQLGIGLGHVEAGLRSGDRHLPFPEEMNRTLIARMASHHFAPTMLARAHLLSEGVAPAAVHVTGNTVLDALHDLLPTLAPPQPNDNRMLLVTLHRRENIGAIGIVAEALREALARHASLHVLWPVHPNPGVADAVARAMTGHPRIRLTAPLGHRAFVTAMRDAWAILSDSGGVQEEAPALGTPVLILRDTTERPEVLSAGVARLVGTRPATILAALDELMEDEAAYRAMSIGASPFGDGHAGERIARIVADHVRGG